MMRVAVLGAGAVGGFFGARLAAAGNDVAFIARGAHLEALQRDGLTLESVQGDLHVRDAVFTDSAAAIGAVDLVLFCVKSYDTESAAQTLAPVIGQQTVVLSLQNGVDNPDKIARLWGAEKTLAGVVYIGSQLSRPGAIKHSAGGKIVFGELDGNGRDSTRAVEQTLRAAQIPCEVSADIRQAQWRKLLWNAPFCALGCVTRATMQEMIESEPLIKLALECMAEVREAAQTQGIELDAALFDETLNFSRSLGAFKPSMLQDLEAGKPLEFEAFNGIVVTLLEAAGKAAPVNRVFYELLKHFDQAIRRKR